MNGQLQMFEGETVEKYQLGFKGTVSDDEVNIEDLVMGSHVCLLVIGEVGESNFKRDKDENVIRVNKLEILRAVELEAEVAEYAIAKQKSSDGTPMLPVFEDQDEEIDENEDELVDA